MGEVSSWTVPDFEEEQEEEREERTNLRARIGKTIIIDTVWFEKSEKYGEFVVLACKEGVFYNFSKRLQKQLRPLSKVFLQKSVKAKVMLSDKNQIYLTKPDPEE